MYTPLTAILLDSIGAAITDFGKLCILAWKPYALFFASNFVLGFMESYFDVGWLLPIGSPVVAAVTGALFLLAVHRYRLLGWNADTKRVPLRIGIRERRFVLFVAILAICLQLPIYLVDLSSDVLLAAAFLVLIADIFLLPRMLLCFPAIALDYPYPWALGWKLGRVMYWKLFGVMLAVGVPAVVLSKYVVPAILPLPLPLAIPLEIAMDLVSRYLLPGTAAIAICFLYRQFDRDAESKSVEG